MKNTILWIFMKDVLANSLKSKRNFLDKMKTVIIKYNL